MGAPKFAHVVFQTSKPTEMRDWYCAVLDGHTVFQDDALCFLTFDEEHHRVALITPPDPLERKSPTAAGAHHVAYTFDNLDDLLARYEKLREGGLLPAVCIAHGVTTSMYYRDPDGNFVEMQIDNFAEPEQATAYMHGDEYREDSVGPAFDPAALLAARRAGAATEELTDRSWALKQDLPDPMGILMGG
ncbi:MULTISPECIES: VOC family protein [unclassified Streptomyces]|uniref:VOC family protein n=1 Tax=unclassified Streptomyces TaxID=2593676 RepID=UPI00278C7E3F|nr:MULTISPECIES: VOC family protein [unclassified Streptomyces]